MGVCEMKVELIAHSMGQINLDCTVFPGAVDEHKTQLHLENVKPTEIVGRAAGICYDKEEKEDYDTFVRRVIKMGHESVIEHVSFTFRVEGVSRALTHQWVRHRLCSFSQRSQRYVKETEPSYVMPPMDYLSTKGHSDGAPSDKYVAIRKFEAAMEIAWEAYNQLLKVGVKGEDARFVLPNACETKMVWTANARELRHFFKMRLDKHAQWEIREMAKRMYDLVIELAPALFDDMKSLRDGA